MENISKFLLISHCDHWNVFDQINIHGEYFQVSVNVSVDRTWSRDRNPYSHCDHWNLFDKIDISGEYLQVSVNVSVDRTWGRDRNP